MKITIGIKKFELVGGAEKVALEQANYLNKHYNVEVIAFCDGKGVELAKGITSKILNRGPLPESINGHLKRIRARSENAEKLRNYLTENGVDLFFGHNIFPFCSNPIKVVTKCFEVHHNNYYYGPPYGFFLKDLRRRIRVKARNILYNRLDGIVSFTKGTKDKFHSNGITTNIFEIPNALPSSFLNVSVKKLHERKNKIVSLARLVEQKGLFKLIEILTPLLKSDDSLLCEIYGEGPLRKLLLEKIEENGISRQLRILNPVKEVDVINILQESKLFVMTSEFEGFPVSILEAMSCGVPVISFDIETGPSDIIDNGSNGFLIPIDNISGFRRAISNILNNKRLWEKLSRSALNKSRFYSWEKIGLKWDQMIKKISNH